MNSFSHIKIGKLVFSYLEKKQGLPLSRTAFLWGNVCPDFTITLVTNPHYTKNFFAPVTGQMLALSQTSAAPFYESAAFSKRLGEICHFLADFFCLAHNETFCQNMAQHVLYEKKLDAYLTGNPKVLTDVMAFIQAQPAPFCGGAEELLKSLPRLHRDYLGAKKSFDTDLSFILYACCTAAGVILTEAEKNAKESRVFSQNAAAFFH